MNNKKKNQYADSYSLPSGMKKLRGRIFRIDKTKSLTNNGRKEHGRNTDSYNDWFS